VDKRGFTLKAELHSNTQLGG